MKVSHETATLQREPRRRPLPPSPFFHPRTPYHQHKHAVVVARIGGGTDALMRGGDDDEALLPENDDIIIVEHKSGLIGCTANMMVAIVGSGIVGIPYAVKSCGLSAGLCLMVLVAVVTEKSLRLLVETAKHIHVPTYETAAEAVYGGIGFKFILINMWIIAYGAMVSYLMIVRDSFSILFRVNDRSAFQQNLVLLAVSVSIQLPLACLRDMADLDKTSRLAVLIDILLVLLVACVAPWHDHLTTAGGFGNLLRHDTIHFDTIFVGLGVLSFAFECQESAFIIAGSLQNPTTKRWSRVTAGALLICAALTVVCGITGYVGYLDETRGNILNNLSSASLVGIVAHGMLGATMFATYPLASFVARHVCVVLLFEGSRAHEGDDTSILNRADRRILLTVALYIVALLPAAFFQDFGAVLALAGVIGGSCLAYIGPGILYLGVHGGRFLDLMNESYWLNPGSGHRPTNSTAATVTTSSLRLRPVTVAVETTPLVASQQQADELMTTQSEDEEWQRLNRRTVLGFIKTCVFYMMGFPIWSKIAAVGKRNLTGHIHNLVSKSLHPIRIGDVQYSIVQILPDGSVDADPEDSNVLFHPEYIRQHSAPVMQGKARHQQVIINDTSDIGKENLLPSKLSTLGPKVEMKKQPTLEPDPQEEPEWLDFFIAIFYIVFGVIALFAGLFSLSIPADSGNGG